MVVRGIEFPFSNNDLRIFMQCKAPTAEERATIYIHTEENVNLRVFGTDLAECLLLPGYSAEDFGYKTMIPSRCIKPKVRLLQHMV